MGDGTEPDDIQRVINDALDKDRRDRERLMAENPAYVVQPIEAVMGPRDLFAAHVMGSILMRLNPEQFSPVHLKGFAFDAFQIADYLMEARKNAEKK